MCPVGSISVGILGTLQVRRETWRPGTPRSRQERKGHVLQSRMVVLLRVRSAAWTRRLIVE